MKTKTHKSVVRRTLRYFIMIALRYKWLLLVNLLAPILAVMFGDIAFRYYLAVLFEQLGKYETIPADKIWRTFYVLMALILAQVTFWRINDYSFLRRQAMSLRDMEQYVFRRVQAHSYRFFSDNFAGSLVTQFNRFLKSYEQLEDIFIYDLLVSAVILIFSIIILLFTAPVLGIALMVWTILFIGFITWLTIRKFPITRAAAAADSDVTASVADAMTNIINVKIFGRNQFESKRFAKTSINRFEKRWRSWKYDAHIRNVRWVMAIVFLFVYIYLSINLIMTGSASLASVLAAQFYIMLIYAKLFDLNRIIQHIEAAFGDAAEMTEILDLTPEIQDPVNPEKLKIGQGLIVFNQVNFRYSPSSNEVLSDFNLIIKPGQKVGLVGHSGSGKSTLTRLIMRFVDLQSGQILIDGQDVTSISQDDLRSNIAFVPQEPILFHRSLIENIRYGRDSASKEEVYEAARLAHASDFIETMPDGYDTLVGERGIKLSGGEKQRVAIARAMLSRAPILVLDEATSALDSKSEKLITSALDSLMRNRTTIVIAHRLSTIRKMDRILVMKNGAIIEDGTHQSLLDQKGEYNELWAHQSGGFLEE